MKYFIAGTDTHIGKTYVTVALLQQLKSRGLRVLGLKPIASGCEHTRDGIRNDDAMYLHQSSNVDVPYTTVNPITLPPPIAPHIAAKQLGLPLSVAHVQQACQAGFSQVTDITLIEGAGGWFVPLNDRETYADFVAQSKIPVILVVGMRLGCINHSLLTFHAIQKAKIPFAGWIANCVEPQMAALEENIATIKVHAPGPLLAVMPYNGNAKHLSDIQLAETITT